MKIKTGDKVKILQGKDRGKTGKVLQVFIAEKKASVEGLNILIKHMRPKKQGEKGQRIEFPAPMPLSRVELVCPKCKTATRVGYSITIAKKEGETAEKRTKTRTCKKCKALID